MVGAAPGPHDRVVTPSPPPTPARPRPSTSPWRAGPWVLYLLTLASALPLGAVVAAAHPRSPGDCEGIGFGCRLYGWDVAGFLLLVLGTPYALALGAVLGLLTLSPRLLPLQTLVALAGLAAPWVFVAWTTRGPAG